jgi:hypothetical protein
MALGLSLHKMLVVRSLPEERTGSMSFAHLNPSRRRSCNPFPALHQRCRAGVSLGDFETNFASIKCHSSLTTIASTKATVTPPEPSDRFFRKSEPWTSSGPDITFRSTGTRTAISPNATFHNQSEATAFLFTRVPSHPHYRADHVHDTNNQRKN